MFWIWFGEPRRCAFGFGDPGSSGPRWFWRCHSNPQWDQGWTLAVSGWCVIYGSCHALFSPRYKYCTHKEISNSLVSEEVLEVLASLWSGSMCNLRDILTAGFCCATHCIFTRLYQHSLVAQDNSTTHLYAKSNCLQLFLMNLAVWFQPFVVAEQSKINHQPCLIRLQLWACGVHHGDIFSGGTHFSGQTFDMERNRTPLSILFYDCLRHHSDKSQTVRIASQSSDA